MRISIYKATGKLIEMQSAATEGTLIQNALNAGLDAADIEEREITEAEWADPLASWNLPTDEQLKSSANAQRSSLLANYDLAIKRLTRAQFFGQDVADQLSIWHTYALALVQMSNDSEWYKASPILWPEQPEMPTDI